MDRVLRAAPVVDFIKRTSNGRMVERVSKCRGCGRDFYQRQVNQDWIARCHPEFQTKFLDTVEAGPGGVHQPPICKRCERDERSRNVGRAP